MQCHIIGLEHRPLEVQKNHQEWQCYYDDSKHFWVICRESGLICGVEEEDNLEAGHHWKWWPTIKNSAHHWLGLFELFCLVRPKYGIKSMHLLINTLNKKYFDRVKVHKGGIFVSRFEGEDAERVVPWQSIHTFLSIVVICFTW